VPCFPCESCGTAEPPQNTTNSRTNTGNSSVFDGREGCNQRSQQASDCGVTALQVPSGSSDDDGRCLIGTIVVERCCESEEDVSSDPEKREGHDDSGDGMSDRPQIQ